MPNVFSNDRYKPLTDTELRASPIPITDGVANGVWGYSAGSFGIVFLNVNERALQITATAGATSATIRINSGDVITIPAGKSLTIEPRGNLFGASVEFTNTEAYFIEKVS